MVKNTTRYYFRSNNKGFYGPRIIPKQRYDLDTGFFLQKNKGTTLQFTFLFKNNSSLIGNNDNLTRVF